MFKVHEGVFNEKGRNHPFLKWIEKMEHVVNTTLLNSYPERSGVTFEPSVNTVGRSSHWLFVTGM